MHILVIESQLSGHHGEYLVNLLAIFASKAEKVTVALPRSLESTDAIKYWIKDLPDNVGTIFYAAAGFRSSSRKAGKDVHRELLHYRDYKTIYRKTSIDESIDYVFLPYLDDCANAIGLLGSPFSNTLWSGICMRQAFHYRKYNLRGPLGGFLKIKELLFRRLLSSATLENLFSIDQLLVRYLEGDHPKIEYLADPALQPKVMTKREARAKLGLALDRRVILVYGALSRRKGLDILVEATLSISPNKRPLIIIAGLLDLDVRESLSLSLVDHSSVSNDVRIFDELVSEEFEAVLFGATDCVWLGYRDHFRMSGVLVKAGLYQRAPLVSKEGILAWYANKGVAHALDPSDFETVVQSLLIESNEIDEISHAAFLEFGEHTWDNVGTLLDRTMFYKVF